MLASFPGLVTDQEQHLPALSVVTATVWVWRAGGCIFLFASLRILADQQNSLTLPHHYLLNNFGRREYLHVLHGSRQEMCAAFQCKLPSPSNSGCLTLLLVKLSCLLWAKNNAEYALLYKSSKRINCYSSSQELTHYRTNFLLCSYRFRSMKRAGNIVKTKLVLAQLHL